jgi:hypothetical protein
MLFEKNSQVDHKTEQRPFRIAQQTAYLPPASGSLEASRESSVDQFVDGT